VTSTALNYHLDGPLFCSKISTASPNRSDMTSSANNNSGEGKTKLFFTTSDLLTKVNDTLKSLDDPDVPLHPRFELQRRLPDGSTRNATPSDQKVADMQSKFQQAAAEVKDLSDADKIKWAALQRNEGNSLYQQGSYQEALDVYLTCLVVKSDSKDFMRQVFLPCLNNLAQCTLMLGMYLKTETFCTMALDELVETNDDKIDDPLVAKLYFRRGKARRLSGSYDLAKKDLQLALGMVEDTQPIQRELQMIHRAVVEAERNRRRQERAMQQMWSVSSDSKPEGHCLYEDSKKRRPYSTLRSKPRSDDEVDTVPAKAQLSYWEYYMAVVGRIAERLLIMTGDKETIGRINEAKED